MVGVSQKPTQHKTFQQHCSNVAILQIVLQCCRDIARIMKLQTSNSNVAATFQKHWKNILIIYINFSDVYYKYEREYIIHKILFFGGSTLQLLMHNIAANDAILLQKSMRIYACVVTRGISRSVVCIVDILSCLCNYIN